MDAFDRAADLFRSLQDHICAELENVDGGGRFREDVWRHKEEGGGRTRVLSEGGVFEKAGVNFSQVAGQLPEEFARQLPGSGTHFQATGISLVLHPRNPFVPTVHANWRMLAKGDRHWYGGGADLTPYYPFREDVIHFHRVWRDVCARHPRVADHAQLKKACDEYFYLPHRSEARGVGGIFFDYVEGEGIFEFVADSGKSFVDSYVPIVRRRMHEPYSDREREFQAYRRGRYVEFNLIYDRGTLFGLKSGGRVESIFMSLPPRVRFEYDYQPAPGTREAELREFLRPRDWADES